MATQKRFVDITGEMNSKIIKAAFAAANIKVRVADHDGKFRICRIAKPGVNLAHDKEQSLAVAASLGLYSTSGRPGGQFNQSHEMIAYTPWLLTRAFGMVV